MNIITDTLVDKESRFLIEKTDSGYSLVWMDARDSLGDPSSWIDPIIVDTTLEDCLDKLKEVILCELNNKKINKF